MSDEKHPGGMTCGDCLYFPACSDRGISSAQADSTQCDWIPSRFVQTNTVLTGAIQDLEVRAECAERRLDESRKDLAEVAKCVERMEKQRDGVREVNSELENTICSLEKMHQSELTRAEQLAGEAWAAGVKLAGELAAAKRQMDRLHKDW